MYKKNIHKLAQTRPVLDLKEVIENNNWHVNQSAYSHTLEVVDHMRAILRHYPILHKRQKVDNLTRGELMFCAGYLHDIGKKDTIIVNEEGKTSCPNHEEKSAELFLELYADQFTPSQQDLLENVIRDHGKIHKYIVGKGHDELRELPYFPELVVLGWADTMWCNLKKIRSNEYKARVKEYETISLELSTLNQSNSYML